MWHLPSVKYGIFQVLVTSKCCVYVAIKIASEIMFHTLTNNLALG